MGTETVEAIKGTIQGVCYRPGETEAVYSWDLCEGKLKETAPSVDDGMPIAPQERGQTTARPTLSSAEKAAHEAEEPSPVLVIAAILALVVIGWGCLLITWVRLGQP